jgi:hypothetical protein
MMKLNTLPIESFLEKARVSIKGGKKTLTMDIKEVTELQNSLSVVMTRLAGDLDQIANSNKLPDKIQIKMDGGKF